MNQGHKVGKIRNRVGRCKKRLADKDLPSEQRSRVSQRLAELEAELAQQK